MAKGILWGVLATVIGEIALVLLTTLAQEVLFGGISYNTSSNFDIIFGGLATFIAAVLAGVITSKIAGHSTYWPHIIISFLITAETIYLIASDQTNDPIWSDALAGLTLILGIWLGRFLVIQYCKSIA